MKVLRVSDMTDFLKAYKDPETGLPVLFESATENGEISLLVWAASARQHARGQWCTDLPVSGPVATMRMRLSIPVPPNQGQRGQRTLRPLMILSRTTMTAITMRIWMNPPSVYDGNKAKEPQDDEDKGDCVKAWEGLFSVAGIWNSGTAASWS